MRCPNPQCKGKLLQKADDGSVKLRTEGIHVFKSDGTCEATCYWCKSRVKIPVKLDPGVLPSSPLPALTVRRAT